ncbi:MAG TPA: YdeI/OmpD-associated family protein [Candidatus Kapabacteria bacterium]|nr:YdeI/OmpD-associated family protein [Candidatus Kapabacteria bacterium]
MVPKKLKFSSQIEIIGVNPYIYLPTAVLKALFTQAGKEKGPIPVKGTLNDKSFIQTLVKYQGQWRLYLNTPMRKAAGIDVGDKATVEIAFDPKPRLEPMPEKFKLALSKDKTAKAAYEKLIPSRKKEVLRYLNSMKTEASLEKNVEKFLMHLRGEKVDTLNALMRVKAKS